MMNAGASAHNKEFLAFFHQDQPPPRRLSLPSPDLFSPHSVQEVQHQLVQMNSQQQQAMQSGTVNMDVLEGLMGLQDRNGQQVVASGGGPQTSQMLMEQQMRLNQLQQLYQLQTQIFQQQVSRPRVMIIHSSPKPSKPRTTGLMRRSTYLRSSF